LSLRLAAPSTHRLTTAITAVLAACLTLLALASSASAAVTQKQAAKKALAALGSESRTDAVVVFGLPTPVKAGTKVTQAGTTKSSKGSTKGISSRLRSAGVRMVKAPRVLTASKRSYFFYEDRGPFQLYQHPGRVALVDVETGTVRLSSTISWPPLLNGRLPAFLKSAGGYRSAKYQVLYRPYAIDGSAQQPRTANRNLFDQDPFGPGRPLPDMANSKAIADRLAAERSCVLRVTDTLPSFWNVNELNLTRSYVGTLFEKLERDNAAFIDDRYGARSGETLGKAVDRMIASGCKDILLYIAGQGYDQDGDPVIQLGTTVMKGGLLAQQNVSASDLRELVSARSGVTFKFKFDAPYSGGFMDRLRDLSNVLLIETPGAEGSTAFSFIPEVSQNGQSVSASSNPAGLLEFTNCELVGLKAFFSSAEEIDKATQAQNEGVSFLAEMLARSQELCKGVGFADDLGSNPQLYAAKRGSGKGTNLPPKADAQNVSTAEDTPKQITLTGSDPDGDPLTFTITKQPDHGTLSGSGANVTYTPAANYNGPDDFSFKTEDDKGASSNTAKVSIDVGAGNDAPVVTNSQNATPYTEQGGAVVVDANLTVSDIDDTQLEGATVRVSSGFQPGDALVFVDQLGITGTYNSGTGVLTLTGTASVSDYQTALRDVRYRNLTNDDPSSPKAIEFKANDGNADSAASTKNIAVTGVNDSPVLDTTDAALGYEEGDGEVAADSAITAADPDSATLAGATVQITSNFISAEDDLTFNNASVPGITGSYNDATGTMTLSGTASVSSYQAALRLVRYVNTSSNPSTATRTVSFRVTDGAGANSNVATRDIAVGPVDDAPDAVNDSATRNEDSGAASIDVLANDTDVDGGPKTISSATDPAKGTVVLTGGSPGAHTGLTYQPDPDYCNDPPGTSPDTFTYTVNGGDTATVSVKVTCVNDDPVANDDTRSVGEDSGATEFDVLTNDTDADPGDAIEITNVSNPANGTATIVQGSPDKVSYTPNANYCNNPPGNSPDTFTYTVTGGDTATVSVTVNCVNDAPVANDDTATVNEDSSGAGNDIAVLSNDTDVENDAIEITAVSDPAKGTATIVQGSPDQVNYVPDANTCGSDTVTYTVNGGDTATVNVTVTCVNDDPVANDDTKTVTEDSSGAGNDIDVLSNDTDADPGDAIEITNVSDPAKGTATIVQGSPDKVNYVPDADYCNSQSGGTPDTFTYTVTGGDTATVSVTVTCVNDATNAENDTATVNEDSGANTINVRDNDTDADTSFGGSKELITQKTDGTIGTVTITNGGADLTYTPNANACGSDSFTYQLAGGDTATVSVTVTCLNDNAVANDDLATVDEDSSGAGNDIAVLSNDTDVENDAIEITNITDTPDHGTATVVQGSPDKINYVPTADYCGPDSLTYEVNGGDTATVSITVTCVNDAPVVDLNGDGTGGINTSVNFNEQSGGGANNQPVTVAPNLDTSDVDDTHLESATIALTNEQNAGQETLAVNTVLAASRGITVTVSVDGDTLTLTSTTPDTVTKQDYEDVLRTVTYNNTADTPSLAASSGTARTITFKVNDGTADSALATATVTIVPLNIAPTLDLNGGGAGENEQVTFTEDGAAANLAPNAATSDADDTHYTGATITLTNAQDGAAESLTVSNAGAPCVQVAGNGSQAITLSGNCPSGDYQTVLRTATYTNTANTPNTTTNRTVEFKVNDGQADSPTRTSTVTVAANNDAPSLTVPGPQSVDEDGSEPFASGDITVDDPDDNGQQMKFTLSVTQGTLTLADTTGVTFTDGTANGQSMLKFTATEQVFDALATQYDPNDNFNGVDTLTVIADDQGNTGAGGAKTDTETVTITVNAVNDAPTNTVPGAQSVDEDTPLVFSGGNGNALSTTDPDSGANPLAVTLDVDHGTLTLGSTSGLTFTDGTANGQATLKFTGTLANVQAALASGVTYQGTLNYNGPDTLTLTVSDQGATGSGGAQSDTDTVAITVNPVNDAPTADNETFGGAGNLNDQAHGNTTMQVDDTSGGDNKSAPTHPHTEIEGDILDGDSDPEGSPLVVQSAGSDAGATNGQTADGGTVTVESDGDFVYNPPASVSCDNGTDSFNYKISDQQNSGAGPIPGTAIGTVTIHLEGCVWYVNNNAAGNAGTSTQPFDTLAQAETASGANHTVFVFDGDNTSTGYQTGFAMNSGERLIGEHEGLTHDQDQGGSMTADSLHPANPGAHPTISGTNEDVVELDDGNEVRGFNIEPTGTGGGIAGASGDTGGGTIDDVNIIDTAVAGSQPLLELDSTTGTFNISNLVANNQAAVSPPNTATGVRLNNAGTVNFNPTGQISIGINGAKGLDAIGTSMGTSTFDDITVAGSTVGGVSLLNTTGTTTLGDGTGSDLSLTTVSGSDAALRVNNGGTVSVAAAGADDLHATGGPALDSTGTTGALYEFDDVDSTNSANDGINIDGLGTGTFSASSGDIGGYAGIGFDLNAGSGAITYPGTFANGSGTFVAEITGRTGGVVSLSGSINDTNDSGGGINLVGNTGGSTVFSGATKQFNTGTVDGVDFQVSDGHTLVLSGGGTDIDTTSGRGIDAETSGTLQVSGSGNTVLTDTGRAINIVNTDIAAADVTFDSVRVNSDLAGSGPDIGIRLDTTGSAGNLAVTGTGGDCTSTASCTGGVIHNTTSDGVRLTSAAGTSLTDLYVGDSDGTGIHAPSGTSNNSFNDLHIHNNGDAVGAAGTPDAGIAFGSMTGTNSITGTSAGAGATTVQQSRNNQVEWIQPTGTGTLNIASTDVLNAGQGAGTGANGISVTSSGSSTANLNVGNGGAGTGDVDITNNPADGLVTNATDTSTLTSDVQNVNFTTGNRAINHLGRGTTVFRIENSDFNGFNPVTDIASAAATISVNPIESATMDGTITNNRVGTAGQNGSGAGRNFGIVVGVEDGADTDLNISNNVVRETAQEGISTYARDFLLEAGSVINYNLTLRDNVVQEIENLPSPDTFTNLNGIEVDVRDDTVACADIANNDSESVGSSATTGTELRVRQLGTSQFRLEGLPANTNNAAVVASFLNTRNPLIPLTEIGVEVTTQYIAEPGNCPMPVTP
jgi:VCBS repeat-containing protein